MPPVYRAINSCFSIIGTPLPQSISDVGSLPYLDSFCLVGGNGHRDAVLKYDPETGRWVEQTFKLSRGGHTDTVMTVKRSAFEQK